ncbi:hypothetical protein [Pectobacterium polaris]|uniref:hypothetical protein n=1 Tax=Pectobacterium polaris TaxID=2042057 RepID=UPI000F8E0282|nr:hypothetical protein [Pectobacterium polaris]RUR90832.1 hypothetical protein KHDHEBDM_03990 [Pectobacterium polaris]
MKPWRSIVSIFAVLYLAGCTNLQPVRDFANSSAELSGYTQLTDRFATTYSREKLYITGAVDTAAQENDKKRKAAYKDLVKIHQTAALYMETLATLAGEDTYDLSDEIKSVAGGIKTHSAFGISAAQVDNVATVTTLISKWATAGIREKAVKEMVREGDAPFQVLLGTMQDLVRLYAKTNEEEKKEVLGFFELEILFADAPKDKLLATLARVHEDEKRREYAQAQQLYSETEQGLKKISEGHKMLLKHLDDLSGEDLKASLKILTKDIKSLSKSVRTLQTL